MPNLPQLSFQPYIQPVGTDEPIDALNQLGQTLNKRYEDNIAQSDALDEHIAQLGTTIRGVDQPILDSLNSDTRDALTNIKQNGDWENAQIPLRQVAKRLLSDPALTYAQQNKATSDKIDALKMQAQAEGHHIIQYQDYNSIPTMNQDGTTNKVSTDGVFDKKLDWLTKQRSIFDGLEPNSTAYKNSKTVAQSGTGDIYQIGSGSSVRYVNDKMIANVVANNLDNYLQTDEGQQQLKVLTTKNSENQIPVDVPTAREMIKHQLLDVGLTRRFHDNSSESSSELKSQGQQGQANQDPNAGTVAVQDTAVPINQDFSDLKDALAKKERTISAPVPAYGLPMSGLGYKNIGIKYNNEILDKSPLYQSMFKLYSQSLGTTNPDKINPLISKYLGSIENKTVSPVLHATYDSKQMEADNKFIQNGAVKNLPIYDAKTGKTYNSMNDLQFQKDYPDIKPEEYEKARMVGRYDQNNPYPEVTGNDNFTTARKISVGGHDFVAGEMLQDKRSGANLNNYLGNKITLADRAGTPVTFSNGKDNMKIFARGDGSYIVQGKGSDGKDLPQVPLSLEQAKTFLGTTGYTQQK